jgi:transposase
MKPFIIHPSPASQQDAKALEQRRLRAVLFFEKGLHQAEVARRCKVSRTAVHYWYTTWKASGKEGLRAGRPGPQSRITGDKAQRVKQLLMKGATAAGYDTNLWTLPRIAHAMKGIVGVSYHPGYVWRIVGALGFTCQKPETRYRDRNEAAIKRWKQERWPAIKKKG